MQPVQEPKAFEVEPMSFATNPIRCDSPKCVWPAVALPLGRPAFLFFAQYQPTHLPDLETSAPEFQSESETRAPLVSLREVGRWNATAAGERLQPGVA